MCSKDRNVKMDTCRVTRNDRIRIEYRRRSLRLVPVVGKMKMKRKELIVIFEV